MTGSLHIKLEHIEALDKKRDVLTIEESILKILNHMKTYGDLKRREFILKNQIKRNISAIRNALVMLDNHLPKEDLLILGNHKIETLKKETTKKEKYKKSNLEEELELIKQKLASLK